MLDDPRAFFLVLDSVGCGALPDAAAFGDQGAHTLDHIAQTVPSMRIENLRGAGLGNIEGIEAIAPIDRPSMAYGRMIEVSQGKDTATGHWEFMGLILDEPFRTFPDGFGPEILDPFLASIERDRALGNKAASGTVIIDELGAEHERTGLPIVYTSADPVFQIAAHEEVVDLEMLYRWCEIAYDIVIPKGLSRVIARPFVGPGPGSYTRTAHRKDYALPPIRPTALDALAEAGVETTGVGKISNIYAGRGVAHARHTISNADGMDKTLELAGALETGLVFTNLVDFDAKFGHRRDPEGYAGALEEFDAWLPTFLGALRENDLVIISADHGNDPTFAGTDHTREYVPLLAALVGQTRGGVRLGTRSSFADIGRTLCDYFDVPWSIGESFLGALR